MKVRCVKCGHIEEKEAAKEAGWILVQKASGPPGELFVLCDECVEIKTAAPAKKVTRRKKKA